MKTKNIFKLFTIIMMLMLTIFTTGCESQQEKYTKASNELAAFEKERAEYFFNSKNRFDEISNSKTSETKKIEQGLKLCEEMMKNIEEYEKGLKEKLENLQKIAKGNAELEKDIRLKWEDYNKNTKGLLVYKKHLEELIKEGKQELAKQK